MREFLKKFENQKKLLFWNGLIPLGLLIWDWSHGQLGANPPEAFIRTTGVMALIFVVLTLAVTPLAQEFQWSWLVKHRRWLGLGAFYYAMIHWVAYAIFDKGWALTAIFADIAKRPFILLGFTAFLLMLPLAITSTNEMIRKLGGRRWKRLHKLTYAIALLAIVHYWMIVKSDLTYPAIFASGIALLLSWRAYKNLRTG